MSATKLAFGIDQDTINRVRKIFNADQARVDSDMKILKEWISQQRHFPDNIPDFLVEKFLVLSKFRINRAKQYMETYFTLKTRNKIYFEDPDVVPSEISAGFVVLPKLTQSCYRVVYSYIKNPDPESLDYQKLFARNILLIELGLRYDYNASIIIIIDFKGIDISHVRRTNFDLLFKMTKFLQTAYPTRVVSIHYLNSPALLTHIMALSKLILNQKMLQRIHIHDDLESLYKMVEKDVLPLELGGDSGTLQELEELWDKAFDENRDFFRKLPELVTNEELRVGKVVEDEIFGVDGTFKKINVD